MKKLLPFILLLTSFSSNAETTSTFKIREENIKFYNYPELRLTISKPCLGTEKNELCKELSFLSKISIEKLSSEDKKDQNPSSSVCTKQLKGVVHIGIDQNNNENSFCKLPNNIYIDGGTLTYYADKNDGIVQKSRDPKKYKKSK